METIKTILAYLISILLCPIIHGIVIFLFSYLTILKLSIFRQKVPSRFINVFSGMVGGFLTVQLTTYIFNFFSIQIGTSLITILVISFTLNGINRIRTRVDLLFEILSLIGDILGLIFGGLIFVWGWTFFELTEILVITFIIVIFLAKSIPAINWKFWNLARRIPDISYQYFIENPEWVVEDNKKSNSDLPISQWEGPWHLYVPMLGKEVVIYGKIGEYENSQNEFIRTYENLN